MTGLRIAACQIDPVVGDLAGNVERIGEALRSAERAGCDLAVTPELAVTGYPPEDLVLKPRFVEENLAALADVARITADLKLTAVVGFVDRRATAGPRGVGSLHNAAAVCHGGAIAGVYAKQLLPNYAVFDEKRYFEAGPADQPLYVVGGACVAVLICEDIWEPAPAAAAAAAGAGAVVVLNGSPYFRGRLDDRMSALAARAGETGCTFVYVNQVGGQDELVFDGASVVVAPDGSIVARAAQFAEEVLVAEIAVPEARGGGDESGEDDGRRSCAVSPVRSSPRVPAPPARVAPLLDPADEVYEALVLGTRDYVHKNGFTGALVGMSGGVDSTLVAVIAADALGPGNVHGVAMPSRYSSEGSVADAEEVARRLGIELSVVPIEPAHRAFESMVPGSDLPGLADENLQSRVRGVTLMYLSNQNGWIVLTTGNKSELAVGYSTLYGDTAGGFAVIKDVPKTLVYDLCRARNRRGEVVPESVLAKAPSAELRPDQRDDQSLPPYDLLDPILQRYVEDDRTVAQLIEEGFDPDLATSVARLVDGAEYKRRQNPPGVRVTPKAFGRDRRMPVTNRYSGRPKTVPSNTVPSNTVPSNTVPSNTGPSNTVPSNTGPSAP